MTLSVNAIRDYSPVNYSRNNLQTKEALKAQPSFGNNEDKSSGKGMSKVAYVMIGGMMVPVMLTSCDKDLLCEHVTKNSNYTAHIDKGCCPVDKDTVYIPVNGGRDTVTQIINTKDTVYLKDNFKSPVIDTINSMLTTLGDDPSKGYIPVKIAYIDEMDTRYKRNVIDGQSSSPNLIIYKGTSSPFDDNQGRFVVGSPLDKHDRWEFTLTRNGNLYATRLIAKDGINNPNYPEDYVLGGDVYVYNHDAANKLIEVFNGGGKFVKSIRPKEGTQNNVEVTNSENTTWNWTNFNVQRADSPEGNN